MNSAVEKIELKPKIKETDKLLYDKLLGKMRSIPDGMPMPSVQSLKNELKVGFVKLKRILAYMEAEGRITIRDKHGIFVHKQHIPAPKLAKSTFHFNAKYSSVPWLKVDLPEISLQIPDGYGELDMWQELVSTYNRSTPYARVVMKSTASEADISYFPSKLERMLAEPDSSSFLDLTPFIEQLPLESPIYDCAWEKATSEDEVETITGVGPYLVAGFIAYQREVFNKAGISWGETPTWEDLLIVGNALKTNNAIQYPFVFSGYMPFFLRWGVSLTDGKQIAIKPGEVAPMLSYLKKMIVEDRITPYWSEVRNEYITQSSFIKKWAAMEGYSYLNINGPEFGIVPFPLGNGVKERVCVPLLSISANSLYPEECWKFIHFVLSKEGQFIVARHSPGLPVAKDISPENICPEKLKAMRYIVEHGQLIPDKYIIPFRVRELIRVAIENWLREETDISKWCGKLEEKCALFTHSLSL